MDEDNGLNDDEGAELDLDAENPKFQRFVW